MKKINVLHLIGKLPLGGAEMLLLTMVTHIDRNRFNIMLCCLDEEGPISDKIRREGINVFCLEEPRFRYSYRKIINLIKIIRKERIDILHTHLYKADFWGRLIAFFVGVPVISKSEHTVQHPMIFGIWSKIRSPFYNIMKLFGMYVFLDHITKAIIYDTKYARNSFVGKKFNPKKHYVVPGGILKSRLNISSSKDMIRAKLGYSSYDFIVIIVARLVKWKGHKFLFEAFAKLSIKYPKMKLLVVGDGPLKDELKRIVIELNIENKTFFIGKVKKVPEYIKMSDILVLPSWREALGIVLLEAMYLGIPVIGTNETGIPEVIEDGISGYLVKTKDSISIEKAILRIINEPNRTKKIVINARKKVDKYFSGEEFTRKFEQIYNSLLGKKEIS